MAKNNLAGLAALGALGMMMSKGKGNPTQVEDAGDVEERMDRANAISRGRTDLVDTGMSTPEPGESPRPDENYGNEGRRTGPIGVGSAPKVRSSPKGPSPLLQSNADPESTRKVLSGLGYSVDEAGRPYRPGMKKGGVVKMAKGGLASSASKRADGIASKGKTRGKIC
jgi:hypothetical protein